MSEKTLIAFNKPYGVITQFSPHEKHEALKNYINQAKFYPAGRLDTDSEGLLLLTNDGRLQAKIAEPKYKLAKTYWAQIEGIMTEDAINTLRTGVNLKDIHTAPATITQLDDPTFLWARTPPIRERKNIPTSWISITIHEGKNRQVRRMCANVGFPCLRLIRTSIGQINLLELELPLGQWQFIHPDQLF